jgi:hypothetical protein
VGPTRPTPARSPISKLTRPAWVRVKNPFDEPACAD